MLSRADSIGVFQVESRAQMSMLPRLKPQRILRSRHRGRDRAARADPGRHGASLSAPPLGQGAGRISLRRIARGCWKRPWACRCSRNRRCRSRSSAPAFRPTRPTGCAARWRPSSATAKSTCSARNSSPAWSPTAIRADFATRCFDQIEGFGTYGFPESHAASFALLVYVSAWIKCFHPDVFACALLNSQPMGFYAPAQIVRDAREHGVEVRPADVNFSDWDCTLEPLSPTTLVVPAEAGRPRRQAIQTLDSSVIPAFARDDGHRGAQCALRLGLAPDQGARRGRREAARRARGAGYADAPICGVAAGSAAPPWNASPLPTRCAR